VYNGPDSLSLILGFGAPGVKRDNLSAAAMPLHSATQLKLQRSNCDKLTQTHCFHCLTSENVPSDEVMWSALPRQH